MQPNFRLLGIDENSGNTKTILAGFVANKNESFN
jgi:hypothetical protein